MKRKNTKIKIHIQPNDRLISVLLALLLAAFLIITSCCSKQGLPPKLYIGDQWIYKQIQGNTTYIRTETVTGEERILGKDCYIIKVIFDSPFDGWIPGWTEWCDKTTYSTIKYQLSTLIPSIGNETFNRVVEYSQQITGSEWPYRVGNEFTVEEAWTRTDVIGDSTVPKTGGNVTIWKVIGIEEIEVGSEKLSCFKTIGYQGGNTTFEYWYSDKAKAYIKHINPVTDELLSYSVR